MNLGVGGGQERIRLLLKLLLYSQKYIDCDKCISGEPRVSMPGQDILKMVPDLTSPFSLKGRTDDECLPFKFSSRHTAGMVIVGRQGEIWAFSSFV